MAARVIQLRLRNTAAANARAAVAAAGGSPAAQQTSANAAAAAADLMSDPSVPSADAATKLQTIAQNHPIAFQSASQLLVSGIFSKWEADDGGAMNPVGGPTRRKPYPVKILPALCTIANTAGSLTWSPQEEFEAFRLCIPSGQASLPAFIQQLQAGDRMMQAQSGRIPAACLSEKSDLGRIDFPPIKLGETISCAVSGAPSGTPEFCAVLLGYAKGKPRKMPDGAELLYERVEPFDVTSVPSLGTATITLQPQRNIIMRRLGLDDTVANFANLFVTFINVQDDPQFVSGVEIPAQLFSELAQDDWLDFDMCQLGGQITIGLRNSHTSLAVTAQGMALADLVRLPGDSR
jgi:hypothetical protein